MFSNLPTLLIYYNLPNQERKISFKISNKVTFRHNSQYRCPLCSSRLNQIIVTTSGVIVDYFNDIRGPESHTRGTMPTRTYNWGHLHFERLRP